MGIPEQITTTAETETPGVISTKEGFHDQQIETARKNALAILIETRYTPPPLLTPPPNFMM